MFKLITSVTSLICTKMVINLNILKIFGKKKKKLENGQRIGGAKLNGVGEGGEVKIPRRMVTL